METFLIMFFTLSGQVESCEANGLTMKVSPLDQHSVSIVANCTGEFPILCRQVLQDLPDFQNYLCADDELTRIPRLFASSFEGNPTEFIIGPVKAP